LQVTMKLEASFRGSADAMCTMISSSSLAKSDSGTSILLCLEPRDGEGSKIYDGSTAHKNRQVCAPHRVHIFANACALLHAGSPANSAHILFSPHGKYSTFRYK
jgi:hypothetical protein